MTTLHHPNQSSKGEYRSRMNSTLALIVEHEIHSRNTLPATDIERGWIIDTGASAHMTPFKRDCKKNRKHTQKNIFRKY